VSRDIEDSNASQPLRSTSKFLFTINPVSILGLALGEIEAETLLEGLREGEAEALGLVLALGDTDALILLDGDVLAEGLTEALGETEADILLEGLADADIEDDGLTEALGLDEADGEIPPLAAGLMAIVAAAQNRLLPLTVNAPPFSFAVALSR
jgi:hypothetical protein